jgi:hypothetical protein
MPFQINFAHVPLFFINRVGIFPETRRTDGENCPTGVDFEAALH